MIQKRLLACYYRNVKMQPACVLWRHIQDIHTVEISGFSTPIGGFRFGHRYWHMTHMHIVTFLQRPVNERPDRDIRVRCDRCRRQQRLPVACMIEFEMEIFDPQSDLEGDISDLSALQGSSKPPTLFPVFPIQQPREKLLRY